MLVFISLWVYFGGGGGGSATVSASFILMMISDQECVVAAAQYQLIFLQVHEVLYIVSVCVCE